MLFTEPSFLFAFLPVLLGLYFLAPRGARNAILTAASLAFYAVGEWRFLPLMILSIGLNFGLALWIERARTQPHGRWVLTLGIASDLILLLVFKYTGWLAENLDRVLAAFGLGALHVPHIALPLGISFFTFHKISYKVDVYRGETSAQRNPFTLALYILFFPQLIAGPIVRYHDIAHQLDARSVRAGQFAEGVRRMIIGLGKKVIIANSVAVVADGIFGTPPGELGPAAAWVGIVCYTLQIYFDFSGYSDMAIGLAHMFGFTFLENFDHPYASRSITEFWRRWHISLSRWFRDYLYIPLGGNRGAPRRTYANLMIVFFLCGLWHGSSWEFVIWGMFHGTFLIVERLGWGATLSRQPRVLQHVYTLLVVMVGWVFFRAGSLEHAVDYLGAMLGLGGDANAPHPLSLYLTPWNVCAIAIAIPLALPVYGAALRRVTSSVGSLPVWFELCEAGVLAGTTGLALLLIAAGTYNPFLYFRF